MSLQTKARHAEEKPSSVGCGTSDFQMLCLPSSIMTNSSLKTAVGQNTSRVSAKYTVGLQKNK
jgi:hypothetical protein